MKPVLAIALLCSLILGGTGVYLATGSDAPLEDGPVAIALGQKLEDVRVQSVDFTDVADFAFTEMRVFEPFTTRMDICRAIDLAGWSCMQEIPSQVPEDNYFVVFRQQSTVVHREFQSFTHGRFVGLPNGYKLSDGAAQFKIARSFSSRAVDGRPQVYLSPARPGGISP